MRAMACNPRISVTPAIVGVVLFCAVVSAGDGGTPEAFRQLDVEYASRIRPLIERFCLDCHSSEERKGELDLERFAELKDVRRDPASWKKVIEMLDGGEMPPKRRRQPSAGERELLRTWARAYLDTEARARAGDPGPVVLRRLSNAEYTYTIRDLTGVKELDPAREFPVDGAAGEGFTNTGSALVMSPSLITKYLDAGKQIARHAVLLPDGIRFSRGDTRRDWSNEILREIRGIYVRHTSGDASMDALNQWNPHDAETATLGDGRVDLTPYWNALIAHRREVLAGSAPIAAIAARERLSAKYLHRIAGMLNPAGGSTGSSPLLDALRERWRRASPGEGSAIAAEIRAWQDRLWKFNNVGHLGHVRPWQEPASPLVASRDFSVRIERPQSGDDVFITLLSGSAGDAGTSDVVEWRRPRIVRPGKPDVPLRDVRAGASALLRRWNRWLAATPGYLAAVFETRKAKESTDGNESDEGIVESDFESLARRHGLDAHMLRAWVSYLGIATSGGVAIREHLYHRLETVSGYSFVRGWALPGVGDLSLVANSSDRTVNIPGTLNAHAVAVHPRPERWVAAGWMSPIDGRVDVEVHVEDAHACGNGVTWALELRRAGLRRVLERGDVDIRKKAEAEPVPGLTVRRGDLISLIIGARNGDHACDLTEIDLMVSEGGPEGRSWALAADCADTIHEGNPHADRYGEPGVWHFYTGMNREDDGPSPIPAGSLLSRWLDADDPKEAARLADAVGDLVVRPLASDVSPADRELRTELTSPRGALCSAVDFERLAGEATPEDLSTSKWGLDPEAFGSLPGGNAVQEENLITRAPSAIEIRLPASLFAGAEFVVSGGLHASSSSEDASVQLALVSGRLADRAGRPGEPAASGIHGLKPGSPIVVENGSPAAARFEAAFRDFRELYPAAMCYARVVPVDEAVTLVLYHREDENLTRLMLRDEQARRLDRLWHELRFVSQDALRTVTALEQILEFATQDADPRKFDPVLEPIAKNAEEFRRQLLEAEPAHLDALIQLARRAYRRPLTARDEHGIRAVYHTLRSESMPHDEAIRLTLARILASPSFLYRVETPGPGADPVPVSDWELASRLSYFLWSSMPDAELFSAAADGRLRDPEELLRQTRRMLPDERTRRMAIEFGCQWLHIRDFDQMDEKSERHFPTFAGLRADMYEESILFLSDLIRNDRPVLDLLDADYTFLTGKLATHYGIPGVTGETWRRVEGVKKYSRGGVLALASTLARQSGASRTSPILRGNWIYETLLGEKLPRPPPNVPQLPETAPEGLTERQLIERHTSDPACSKCHRKIDPYGFALEGFDAIGRFREKDEGGLPIDTRTTLPGGAEIVGLDGLRRHLLTSRRDAFLGQLCRKLLGYALGRAVRLSDEILLSEIMENLENHGWRFSAAVETVVLSRQFRQIRGGG